MLSDFGEAVYSVFLVGYGTAMPPEPQPQSGGERMFADHVEDAFKFLQHPSREWALNFLLAYDSDAPGDVSGLSNSVSYSQGDASMCFVVASPVPLSPDSSHRQGEQAEDESPQGSLAFELNFLSIPVWQAGGVCVGISIQQIVGRYGHSNKFLRLPGAGREPQALGVGRFAREEATGTHTTILLTSTSSASTSQGPSLHISHRVLEGTRTVRRSIFQCDYATLSRHPKHQSSFSVAGLMLKLVDSTRSCPICSATSEESCDCTFGFQEGNGGLDFQFFRKNSSLLHGTETGKVSSRHREQLQDAFRIGTMFFEGTSAAREGGTCFDSLSISLRNLAIQGNLSSSAQVSRGIGSIREGTIDRSEEDVHHGASYSRIPRSSEIGSQVGEVFEEPVFLDFVQTLERGGSDFPFLAISDKEKGPDRQSPIFRPITRTEEIDPALEALEGTEGEDDTTLGIRRAADCGESLATGADGIEQVGDGESATQEQQRKIARKLRNRLAAARSNQRRKEKLEELREGLESFRKKKYELQERQGELLAENLKLKDQLSSKPKPE